MADRGILFSAPMVRALLDGRKTQTRRLLYSSKFMRPTDPVPMSASFDARYPPPLCSHPGEIFFLGRWQRLASGDRLWVRETWSHTGDHVFEIYQARMAGRSGVIYRADDNPRWPHAKWWPSIHMPREFSRITLTVTDVRVERLQAISEADARAEGIEQVGRHCAEPLWKNYSTGPTAAFVCPVKSYRALWNSLHGKTCERWADDPWVVAVSFDVREGNIDG